MAHKIEAITKEVFGFTSVQIFPDEYLGSGAYGTVCKAMCDELPCAAKVLHSSLFQFSDPGLSSLMAKFQQECVLMSRLRHPSIVQYLGTAEDPETKRPILLMELMDESLTKLLEHSTASLAYHVQVNISYDVALALSYLHGNGVVHRDLSSNNVLLTAGSRAKVTDFGMLKLLEGNRCTDLLTKCPGTVAYMPPEALSDESKYTNKLDCFSFGVLIIQIITRNFPEPTKATVTVYDSKYPTGRVLVPVREVDRRKKDVDVIEVCHPLRQIALNCIKDNDIDRPSASEICKQLSHLGSQEEYKKSLQKGNHISDNEHSSLRIELQRLRDECAEVKDINREKDRQVAELVQQLQESNRHCEADDLRRTLSELRMSIDEKNSEIEELRKKLYKYETKSPNLLLCYPKKWSWSWDVKLNVSTRRAMWRGAATSVESLAFFNPGLTGIIYVYDSTTNDVSELPHCTHNGFTLVAVKNHLTAVGGNKELYTPGNTLLSFSKGKWVEELPPMPTKRYFPAAVCSSHFLVVAGGCGQDCQALSAVEIMEINAIQWSTVASLPVGISSASMTACDNSVYLLGDDSNRVHCISLKNIHKCKTPAKVLGPIWSRVADLPVSRSTAVTICGQLVSVGGYDDRGQVDAIYCYDSERNIWEKTAKLLSAKGLPLATCLSGNRLIVVHGNHEKTVIGVATTVNN